MVNDKDVDEPEGLAGAADNAGRRVWVGEVGFEMLHVRGHFTEAGDDGFDSPRVSPPGLCSVVWAPGLDEDRRPCMSKPTGGGVPDPSPSAYAGNDRDAARQ